MTPEAKDLIEKLLKLDENERITRNGSEELRSHPFFEGIDWKSLRTVSAPIIPQRSPEETVTVKTFNEQERSNPFHENPSYKDLNKNEVLYIY